MTEPILDTTALARLLAMFGGDPEDLRAILDEFRNGAPDLVARMQAGARLGDADAMRIAAHTLKSNARDVGAMRLSAHCAALEAACRDAGPADPDAMAAIIAQEAATARAALDALDVYDLQRS